MIPTLEFLLRDDFSRIGKDLAVRARRLDASVSVSDILQACRNAWTACGLQPLLGQPIRVNARNFRLQHALPL